MIRVDLGKDEIQRKKSPLARLISGLGKKKKKTIAPAGKSRRVSMAIKSSVALAIAISLAIVPHLFISEYKKFVMDQHEAEKIKLEEKMKILTQEIAKYAPFERELKSYEAQKELVKGKIEVVRQLLAARGTPVNVMDAVGQSLPKSVWLDTVEFEGNQGRTNLKITGKALENDDISDYVDRLSESVHVSDVSLTRVSPVQQERVEVKGFEITAKPKVTFPAAGQAAANPARVRERR